MQAVPIIKTTLIPATNQCSPVVSFEIVSYTLNVTARTRTIMELSCRDLLQIQVWQGSSDVSRSNYQLLGWLSLVQLGFMFLRHLYSLSKSSDAILQSGPSMLSRLLLVPASSRSDILLQCFLVIMQ